MSGNLKEHYCLDPRIVYLNHGSFGACPRPVFEAYQQWQRELEHQPVAFLGRRLPPLLTEARAALAGYVGASDPGDLIFFTNPTAAVNMVARSLVGFGACNDGHFAKVERPSFPLQPGDEILATDHEYGAMEKTWDFIASHTGIRYVKKPIELPVIAPGKFVEQFWQGVTERTKVIFVSHITSWSSLVIPIAEICRRARETGILTVIDGAHAPSQLPLDLEAVGADIYAGACHKWLSAPKGSSFIYANRRAQEWLEPLIISFGWGREVPEGMSPLEAYQQGQGTRDPSAFLSVPAAIRFQEEHDWPAVRRRCHRLAFETRRRINSLTGLDSIYADTTVPAQVLGQEAVSPAYEWFSQMVTVRLPDLDPARLHGRLLEEYQIEVPVFIRDGQTYMRISFQGYNDESDAEALVAALEKLLPEFS